MHTHSRARGTHTLHAHFACIRARYSHFTCTLYMHPRAVLTLYMHSLHASARGTHTLHAHFTCIRARYSHVHPLARAAATNLHLHLHLHLHENLPAPFARAAVTRAPPTYGRWACCCGRWSRVRGLGARVGIQTRWPCTSGSRATRRGLSRTHLHSRAS